MGNGKNGCEFGRTNRLLIQQLQESHKIISDRVWYALIGIGLTLASVWVDKLFTHH